MAFGTLDDDGDDVMNEINMTPLVDVMLVLLIIFMITMPVLSNQIKLDLPRAAASPPDQKKPLVLNVAIDANGQRWLDGKQISEADLEARFKTAAPQQPQPELHLSADRNARYELVAQTMAMAQRDGLGRIGFVTDPSGQMTGLTTGTPAAPH
ncbi:biopolymer transport protein ExbD [Andreprevotia lacus DSM 23236]|jgi:biopolymer transport protein ExbD|uniref:Biopolymer transport protein ExbD n=1 Tax=Andreprevotia lacus DSM 23236 TaxID=1121001 RepID=A0A1W1XRI5_9NEIS|nr:biopolymer transporter ExbD [Andreprevotia lacus]SMC26484.1 biopolymer transport protein ExbD [Andreprevotia lacus DSM 23236]